MIEAESLSQAQVPCRTCTTLTIAYRATREDYRFPRPFGSASKGLCESCKAALYQRNRAGLQLAYRDWLAAAYPTPSYVYGLLDPRTRDVRYIGRTENIAKRMASHRREQRGNAKSVWIDELHTLGLTFEYCILSVVEPGYHVVEQEARWIYEGVRRGWPLLNEEATNPYIVERMKRDTVDHWNCPYSELHGNQATVARINAYAQWSEQMLPAIPHWFIFHGAKGLMTHEHPGL